MISDTTATRLLRFCPRPTAMMMGVLLRVATVWGEVADLEPRTFWKRIEEKGLYEQVWEKLQFYEDEENPILQAASFVGRYHGQYWSVDAEEGRADAWENRRLYLGAEALLFREFTIQAQVKISDDLDPFYDGLYQAFVDWSPNESFSLDAGRLDFLFAGLERSISSTKIATFERGLLVNQLLPGEVVGAVAGGKRGKFSYRAGIMSGSIESEFTHFKGGIGTFAGMGYSAPLFYESGSLHLDYLFNDGHSSNNALESYDHVFSLWHQGNAGPFSLGVDLTWGHGLEARPAVFGVTVLPKYVFANDLIRKGDAFQLVLRYQFAVSDGDNGLQLQPRYEQEIAPDGFGDRYHGVYGGINYLIFGDRLKLMSGAEYAVMHDSAQDGGEYDGWTYLTGVRVYF